MKTTTSYVLDALHRVRDGIEAGTPALDVIDAEIERVTRAVTLQNERTLVVARSAGAPDKKKLTAIERELDGLGFPLQSEPQQMPNDGWVVYNWSDRRTHPPRHEKYFVHRKDGSVHWETWNGIGWAYNCKVITHWREVAKPTMRNL